jgi:hypothetical protein
MPEGDRPGTRSASLQAFVPWSKLAGERLPEFDEFSIGSMRTTDTGMKTMLGTVVLEHGSATLFSFTVKVEQIEFMIVEEELFSDGHAAPYVDRDDTSSSRSTLSEMSVLTDDFGDDRVYPGGKVGSESIGDPVVPSTDYLIFSVPEKSCFVWFCRRLIFQLLEALANLVI